MAKARVKTARTAPTRRRRRLTQHPQQQQQQQAVSPIKMVIASMASSAGFVQKMAPWSQRRSPRRRIRTVKRQTMDLAARPADIPRMAAESADALATPPGDPTKEPSAED